MKSVWFRVGPVFSNEMVEPKVFGFRVEGLEIGFGFRV